MNEQTPTIDALNANEGHLRDLYDSSRPGHRFALEQRQAAFTAAYGDAPAEPIFGSSDPQIVPDERGGYKLADPPTAAEQTEMATRAAELALERNGLDHDLAHDIASWGRSAGVSSLDLADIAEAVISSKDFNGDVDRAMGTLGSDRGRLVERAQKAAAHFNMPQWLLNLEHGGLRIGDNPAFVKAMARLADRWRL